MRDFIKKFILFCGVYTLIQGFNYTVVLASNNMDKSSPESTITNTSSLSSTSSNSTNDPNSSQNTSSSIIVKSNIPVNKNWKIKFSEPLDMNSIKGKITVTDKNNTDVSITLSLTDNNKSVIVAPVIHYQHDSYYTLTIRDDIVSVYDRKLKNPTVVDFTTAPYIVSIDNISKTIEQEDNYSLPTKVSANMSNDSTSSVNISWDKPLTMTSIPGNYIFKGTVEGYDKKVTLQLTIKPFVPVQSISNAHRTQRRVGTNLYNYLMNYNNRQSVLKRAIELHGGDTSNNCVYFASEALRRAGLNVPTYVANTLTLTSVLKNMGWKICYDLSMLLPGDICFTTSYGYGPTHTYTFMKWADPKNFHYAYICDNQGYDYGGNAYHIRNIDFATSQKDSISYFMYLA